uniref:G protein pathway suppressor 2 n=2 Tax=Proconiini TaxID=565685 RepID=A0A1B6FG78_9HEMI
MPAVVVVDRPPQRSEAMWLALKAHIIRERQKKKQEQEADAEVERQRKERERQQKQDKMTLGETREQISQLEQRLQQLKEEKHQLFLQLKKVLNEDDNRRRQLVKESNDVMEMYGYPGVALGNPQLFLQQNIPLTNRNPLYKVPPSHTLLQAGTLKRRRSPSPANYPQYGTYKPATSQATYQKVEDRSRGHEYVRAVLWNKPYGLTESSQYGPFYTTSTTMSYSAAPAPAQAQTVYTYGGPQFQASSSSSAPPPPATETANPTPKHHYMAQQRPHNPSYLHVTIDAKPPFPEENFYSPAQIRPATHVPLHGGAIPIQQPPQGAKTGGITSGYPIRTPASAPTATTPHSVYASQPSSGSRLVYSQSVTTQPAGITNIRYTVPPMQREA